MILDLSLNGAYAMSDALPAEGESIEVRFRVPGNDRVLRFKAIVAWRNPHQAHPVHSLPPGFGMCFVEPSAGNQRLLAQTITAYLRTNPLYRQYL